MQSFSFCTTPDPFDSVQWCKRTATIQADDGSTLFELADCEFPEEWSQLAVNIVASKYFTNGETSLRQLLHRVCRTIADWGLADRYFNTEHECDRFYRELVWLSLHQYAAFNSPVWFNVGLFHEYHRTGESRNWRWDTNMNEAVPVSDSYQYPQASACFIQSVDDTMESIMNLARNEAVLFKYGSGTGTNLSSLRASCESLSNGGKPSGPLSFMRVYDQIAAVVKSGGKTRRAAKMQILDIDHPDIVSFCECKVKEEEKAKRLIASGLTREDAYSSVLFQNANLSVRLSNDFMQAVQKDENWSTHFVTDPSKEGPVYKARELFRKIAQAAWSCGDPGVQFSDRINWSNTSPYSGTIRASNPCSEFFAQDNTACNLASMNLMKFRNDVSVDHERFMHACRVIFTAQDILIDRSGYPTKEIAEKSHRLRPIGLGYSNLGALIMSHGYSYDSNEARELCAEVTSLLQAAAMQTSIDLAEKLGPFDEYEINKTEMGYILQNMLIEAPDSTVDIFSKVFEQGERIGYRNSQFTLLAPTGTISFMMDCDTTGIEPDIALVKYKQLAGGGTLKMVNRTVSLALEKLGYSTNEIESILAHIEQTGSIENAPSFKPEHLPVFDYAFAAPGSKRSLSWPSHIHMMAAAQPFLSGGISKTVNMPLDATVEDIENAFTLAWEQGLKSIAVYRDGSKGAQPLSTSETSHPENRITQHPKRERLPDVRHSITHKFSVAGHEGYLHVGHYPDNRVGEIFIKMAKEGSTIGGLMDSFATALSLGLQYGVPLHCYIDKFTHVRFEPTGSTKNPDIPMAKSLVDYIFRWLDRQFITNDPHQPEQPEPLEQPLIHHHPFIPNDTPTSQYASFQSDAPTCDTCGSITVRNGSCYLCYNCGRSLGCS